MIEKISIISNLWVRQVELKHGDTYGGHSHTFDHHHLLCVGSIKIKIGSGVEKVFTAPQMIFIPKNETHEFTAMTDETLGYCVHPIRNGKRIEDIISEDMKVGAVHNLAKKGKIEEIEEVEQSKAVVWDVDKKELQLHVHHIMKT